MNYAFFLNDTDVSKPKQDGAVFQTSVMTVLPLEKKLQHQLCDLKL